MVSYEWRRTHSLARLHSPTLLLTHLSADQPLAGGVTL